MVVIGAGIFGASIAFQLVMRGAGRVVLIDGAGPAAGNSGRTFGQVRRHYSNELMIRLANRGFEILEGWADEVGVGDPAYVRTGYLLMVPEASAAACAGNVALGRRCGVDTRFVSPEEIRAIEPLVSIDGVAGGAYEPDGGFVDVTKMILSWLEAATTRGLVSLFGSPVVAIESDGTRVIGVRTERDSISAPVVVNAAGAWGPGLVASLGVNIPVSFVRLRMARLRQPPTAPLLRAAVTDAAGGLVMRPDSGPFALAAVYEEESPSAELPDLDRAEDPAFEALVRRTVERRVPAYANAAWAGVVGGIYDVTPDWHPIVGWAPGMEGLYLALGWSGHGLKLAPAVGEVVSDAVLGREPFIEISALRAERFEEGRLMRLAYGPGARA